MATFFDEKESSEASQALMCEVYILYFDEKRGHTLLLAYPDEDLIDDKVMRPVNIHSIWFLSFSEQEVLDHVDLEYKNKTYFAKKFLVKSEREKKRAGLKIDSPETIVIMVAVPTELDIFGGPIIKKLAGIIMKYDEDLWKVIDGESSKSAIIKTDLIAQKIAKSEKIKFEINQDIEGIINKYFHSIVKKGKSDSIKKQRAMSYLALKGFDVSSINGFQGMSFDNVALFEKAATPGGPDNSSDPFIVSDINLSIESNELELLIENNTDNNLHDIRVSITHVKEFFEKEIFRETIEEWYPHEELLFIAPLFPQINSYLLIVEDLETNQKILRKIINVNVFD